MVELDYILGVYNIELGKVMIETNPILVPIIVALAIGKVLIYSDFTVQCFMWLNSHISAVHLHLVHFGT